MKNYLLLEIVSEELPVSYIKPAIRFLAEKFSLFLKDNNLEYEDIKIFFTPKRIGFLVSGLPERRKIEFIEIQGPPKHIAFNEKGNLKEQGIGFLRANRAKEKDIIIKRIGDKEYLFIKKKVGGESLLKIFSHSLPNLIKDIPFPKSMIISENFRFARPLHSICCLFNKRVIKFQIGNLKSSQLTYPHRDKSFSPIKINDAQNYFKIMKKNGVIPLYEERKRIFYKNLNKSLKEINGQILEDKELIYEMLNICEYPSLILCQFEKDYLSLPKEVIITALRNYLHALAVLKNSRLLPYFICVINKPFLKDKKKISEIKIWFEKACQARLEDAKYYFEEDLKTPLEKLVEEEKKVIWIEDLGTLYDKTKRLKELIRNINEDLIKIAELSKADLLTNMVREKEFTSLQGKMGGIYAKFFNYPEEVCNGLYEQYEDLPKTKEGAYLTIVDRIDNIIASFIKGAIPKGSYDPFGLKKQADNIINTIIYHNFDIYLIDLIIRDIEQFLNLNINFDYQKIQNEIYSFFKERLELYLLEKGFSYDIVRAVSKTIWANPKRALKRCEYLKKLKEEKKEDYEKIVIGQKRINNILKGITIEEDQLFIDLNLLIKDEEKELYRYSKEIEEDYLKVLNLEDYEKALNYLLSLRPYIDRFFDNVFVMANDLNIRNNRLKILKLIKSIFDYYCDFSECVI